MTRLDAIIAELRQRWSDNKTADICVAVLTYLVSNPPEKSQMLSYSDLARIAGVDVSSTDLHTAVALLAGRFSALSSGFVFFDEDDAPHYLDPSEKYDLLTRGHFAHPSTGDIVQDAESQLYPYFKGELAHLLDEVRA